MYEAERIIRDEIAEQEKWLAQVERRDEARAAVIKKYTAIIGLDEATLRKAIASVEQYVFAYDEFPPQARFSSSERRRQMQAMYDEWMACYEVMEV